MSRGYCVDKKDRSLVYMDGMEVGVIKKGRKGYFYSCTLPPVKKNKNPYVFDTMDDCKNYMGIGDMPPKELKLTDFNSKKEYYEAQMNELTEEPRQYKDKQVRNTKTLREILNDIRK